MRILIVTNRYPTVEHPGDSPAIARQKESLEQLGHEVDVLLIQSRKGWWTYAVGAIELFWRVQVRRHYDLVHAHYGHYCGLVAGLQWSVPLIVTFRGSDLLLPKERRVSQLVARRATRTIVMTQQMQALLEETEASVIPYGIDLEVFRPVPVSTARGALQLPDDTPLVLFPYDPQRVLKRYPLVEEAVDHLRGRWPSVEIVAMHDETPDRVALFMNACDVLAMTSRSEGAPSAVREALACCLPIVSVDVGDVTQVTRGVAPTHIVPADAQAIAEALSDILAIRSRSNGATVSTGFGLKATAQRVESVYQEATARR